MTGPDGGSRGPAAFAVAFSLALSLSLAAAALMHSAPNAPTALHRTTGPAAVSWMRPAAASATHRPLEPLRATGGRQIRTPAVPVPAPPRPHTFGDNVPFFVAAPLIPLIGTALSAAVAFGRRNLKPPEAAAMVAASGGVAEAKHRQMRAHLLASLSLVRETVRKELEASSDHRVRLIVSQSEDASAWEVDEGSGVEPGPSAARTEYIARVRHIASTAPTLLIAHDHLSRAMAANVGEILGSQDTAARSQEVRLRVQLASSSLALEDLLRQDERFTTSEAGAIVGENDRIHGLTLRLLQEGRDLEVTRLFDSQLTDAHSARLRDGLPTRMSMGAAAGEKSQPTPEEEEQEKEQAFLRAIDAEVRQLTGEGFEALMSPSKVVRLEKELLRLREELDGCADPSRRTELVALISSKADASLLEKRSVMRGWLGGVFRGQAVVSVVLSGLCATNHFPGIAEVDLPIRALGFWSWWLFTIPSLRAIKPLAPQEKSALDWAFLGTLVASLLLPFLTRDTGAIWAADAVLVAACYAAAYALGDRDEAEGEATAPGGGEAAGNPAVVALQRFGKFAATALDFGSGRERGTVQTENKTAIEAALEQRLREKAARAKEDAKGAEGPDP